MTEIVIPAEIDGLPVTSIGTDAFNSCESLISVEIPDSITEIWDGAFFGCANLTSISIPKNVENINFRTFTNCSSLEEIIIPKNVATIGDRAFGHCDSLAKIIIENPSCEFYNSPIQNDWNIIFNAINWDSEYEGGEPYFNGTIYGYENSTAQAYAEKWGYNFEAIN